MSLVCCHPLPSVLAMNACPQHEPSPPAASPLRRWSRWCSCSSWPTGLMPTSCGTGATSDWSSCSPGSATASRWVLRDGRWRARPGPLRGRWGHRRRARLALDCRRSCVLSPECVVFGPCFPVASSVAAPPSCPRLATDQRLERRGGGHGARGGGAALSDQDRWACRCMHARARSWARAHACTSSWPAP